MRTPAGAIDVCGSVVIMPISCIDTHILYNIQHYHIQQYSAVLYCTCIFLQQTAYYCNIVQYSCIMSEHAKNVCVVLLIN